MEFYILMFGASIDHITTVWLKQTNKQINKHLFGSRIFKHSNFFFFFFITGNSIWLSFCFLFLIISHFFPVSNEVSNKNNNTKSPPPHISLSHTDTQTHTTNKQKHHLIGCIVFKYSAVTFDMSFLYFSGTAF